MREYVLIAVWTAAAPALASRMALAGRGGIPEPAAVTNAARMGHPFGGEFVPAQDAPAPTAAPDLRRRRVGMKASPLEARADLGPGTCGFIDGDPENPLTCVGANAYCANDGVANMDCCDGPSSACVSTMFSSCIDFIRSLSGACSAAGPRTLCW